MKEGWIERKLSECFKLKSGDGLTSKAMNGGGYPVYGGNRIAGMHDAFNLSGDNVIVGRVGALCGRARNITENIWLTDNAFKLVNFEYEFNNGFLAYLLNYKNLRSLARQAAQPVISNSSLKDLALIFPVSITEQKRIAAILDEAFEGIAAATANAEQNLKSARELFESYLQSVFEKQGDGWEVKKVVDISDSCLGKMLDKKKNKGDPKPYLRNLNVQWFDIGLSDVLEMRFEESEHERFAVKKGDLLICEGGYPGRAAIWNQDEEIYFQKALHRVRCHQAVHNRWLLYYLYLSDSTGHIKQHFTGAGIQHFTGKALKQFIVPIPPVSQVEIHLQKFDALFEQVQRLEVLYQKKLNALTELKQSILQKAFAGELH